MKNQKKIELLTDFQLFLYEKGFIEDYLWEFEKQAKKFVKKHARQKRLERMIQNSGSVAATFVVNFEKSEPHLIDEFKAVTNTVGPPEDDIKAVETGKGRRLYSKCNRGDVVRSYVEESNLNKGFYVLVIQCRNGKKYVVSGDHYAPTYLQPYNQSSDTKETNNEK